MKHLGGHQNVTHIDSGILSFFKNKYNCQSLLDIGCGPRGQIELAIKLGYLSAVGVDGDPAVKGDNVVIHDFTKGSYAPKTTFDLGWSCEFLEHVEEKYINNFMPCFKKCKIVALTHAPPNAPGYHHVNCQSNEYWWPTMKKAFALPSRCFWRTKASR